MNKDVIGFKTAEPLRSLLSGPIERASLLENQHGYCVQITLWHSSGKGVAVYSEMHDVAEKLEVGVLALKRTQEEATSSSIAFPKPGTPRIISFHDAAIPTQVWKMRITKAGTVCESGLRIVLGETRELVILPSAFPCFVSIFLDNDPITAGASEYEIAAYEQELVS